MTDTPLASDLSYLVLQKRRRDSELSTPPLDSTLQRLYALPSALVQREAFIADRAVAIDQAKARLVQRHG